MAKAATTHFRNTSRSTLRRHPERGFTDRKTILAILDEGLVCHVGLVHGDEPLVIPMAYGRVGDELILHGSPQSRMMKSIAQGKRVCATVTILDGLVLARSNFHSSMAYRSVILFGRCREVAEESEKKAALDAFVDHVFPGRSRATRPTTAEEIAATLVLALRIDEATAKVNQGPPKEPERDRAFQVWAGVVPLSLVYGEPIAVPDLDPEIDGPSVPRQRGENQKVSR